MAIKKIKVNGTDHEIHLLNTLSFKKNGSSAGAFDGSSNVEVDLTPTIDSSLNSTSTNPVQNKVVKAALDAKAPINHSSESSQYGQGTRQKFGHVLLCDDIEATWDEDSGLAATPYAVKRVYDYAKGFKAYSIMRFQNATSTYADTPTDGDGFFEAIAHRHGDTIGFVAGNNLINFEVTDHGSETYGTDSVVVTVNADYNGAADEALAESKNYTDTKISGLINGAPAALDTLNELATALGKDANFSTTITNLIGTKLPLAGGTLTGNLIFNASTNANGTYINWNSVGGNTPYIGYAKDQSDGTFIICSMEKDTTNGVKHYKNGLAIGGGSGNLFWKGVKVATVDDIPSIPTAIAVFG